MSKQAVDDPALYVQVGEKGSDLCPKHDVRETCVLVGHNHLLHTCYRTYKMGCGYLFAVEQPIDHCSDGDTLEEIQDHALGHMISCQVTTLCPDCKSLGEDAIKRRIAAEKVAVEAKLWP